MLIANLNRQVHREVKRRVILVGAMGTIYKATKIIQTNLWITI